ncbi:MAG: hypothetical protein U0Q18_18580 [Bryobacteraceae bacterium]
MIGTMDTPQPRLRAARSIGALVGGIAPAVVLSLATDAALRAIGVFPPAGYPPGSGALLLALIYRSAYGIAGSYLVARLAPDRPMGHALVSGTLGLLVSTAGLIATWNAEQVYGPRWYPLALVATALPCGWVGGWLYLSFYTRRLRRTE